MGPLAILWVPAAFTTSLNQVQIKIVPDAESSLLVQFAVFLICFICSRYSVIVKLVCSILLRLPSPQKFTVLLVGLKEQNSMSDHLI